MLQHIFYTNSNTSFGAVSQLRMPVDSLIDSVDLSMSNDVFLMLDEVFLVFIRDTFVQVT